MSNSHIAGYAGYKPGAKQSLRVLNQEHLKYQLQTYQDIVVMFLRMDLKIYMERHLVQFLKKLNVLISIEIETILKKR